MYILASSLCASALCMSLYVYIPLMYVTYALYLCICINANAWLWVGLCKICSRMCLVLDVWGGLVGSDGMAVSVGVALNINQQVLLICSRSCGVACKSG